MEQARHGLLLTAATTRSFVTRVSRHGLLLHGCHVMVSCYTGVTPCEPQGVRGGIRCTALRHMRRLYTTQGGRSLRNS